MKTRCTVNRLFLGILVVGTFLFCAMATVPEAQAEPSKATATVAEELEKLKDGWVSITLNSGATFNGKVMKVDKGMVHLSKVQDKGYYEALIRLDDISALGARFRSKKKSN